jgi:ATP/maltotriose-dependent transcriptional regulator MalT
VVTANVVDQARAAYDRNAWREARDLFAAADDLGPEDLERLAFSAYLTGQRDSAAEALEKAHHAFIESHSVARGARCAFWLGMILMQRGDHARGGGWFARAQHILDEQSLDCVELGYLRVPAGLHALASRDHDASYRTFADIKAHADRFGDVDLRALGMLGQGQSLIARGDAIEGLAMLDETMVAVTTGEVSPIIAGIIYCATIIACREAFDVRRAQEWTSELSRWCATHQDLKPYRGQCLVHRSEIMQLRGDWADAMDEAQRAREHLAKPAGDPVLGMALYQQAELLRLRGELNGAEVCYRDAGDSGHPIQPGMALLRLAQGRIEDASAAIQRALSETEGPVERSKMLAAFVEIRLASGDVESARSATDELESVAAAFDSPYLQAVVEYARGSVLLAQGDSASACGALRRAWAEWYELDAPYEAARVRLQMAAAYRQLGDHDTADMELDAARRVFEQLGAAPDLDQLRQLARPEHVPPAGGLTAREVEVLRLLATGATNREIADVLVISEHTARRHLQNIFAKIDVSSRAAATAYAYEHGLV